MHNYAGFCRSCSRVMHVYTEMCRLYIAKLYPLISQKLVLAAIIFSPTLIAIHCNIIICCQRYIYCRQKLTFVTFVCVFWQYIVGTLQYIHAWPDYNTGKNHTYLYKSLAIILFGLRIASFTPLCIFSMCPTIGE